MVSEERKQYSLELPFIQTLYSQKYILYTPDYHTHTQAFYTQAPNTVVYKVSSMKNLHFTASSRHPYSERLTFTSSGSLVDLGCELISSQCIFQYLNHWATHWKLMWTWVTSTAQTFNPSEHPWIELKQQLVSVLLASHQYSASLMCLWLNVNISHSHDWKSSQKPSQKSKGYSSRKVGTSAILLAMF